MLKVHKNSLLETIKESGFRPDQFEVIEGVTEYSRRSLDTFTLVFKGSDIRFLVRTSPNDFNFFELLVSLNAPGWPLGSVYDSYVEIGLVQHQLRYWLGNVVGTYLDDQTAPDLWAEAQAETVLFVPTASDSGPNSEFTDEQKQLLRLAIAEVGKELKKILKPTKAELVIINERLDYLAVALDRLNRFDWKNILLSTMIGLATNLSVDTARGAQLYQAFRDAFAMALHLIKH